MFGVLKALGIGLAMGHAVWATQIAEHGQNCSSVHFFLARGTFEPYPGRQSELVNATCSQLSNNCDYEDIVFPAISNSTDGFCWSTESGVQNGTKQLIDYANRCPDTKLVISGYSQGAQVVTDILGGGGGQLWGLCKQALNTALDPSTNASRNLAAAIVFGDTRHTANQSYNVLSGWDINGYAIRTKKMLSALDVYATRMRSYCDKNDPICCRGHDINVHLDYFDNYTDTAASWLASTINNATIPYQDLSGTPAASSYIQAKVSPTASPSPTASNAAGQTAGSLSIILALSLVLCLYSVA
ncbi:hypothetical protein NECHADRAFT_8492 [Paecilomyces variotii No. 5]|uniref:Cutinase n=1 Tax=Byssochlamys spectabilis (strain No. 5 / NBRC 109023) TaxID=1356009 RepID=V5I613_BYSSN|nr:hypothetical protein NECHADRAFT_8492 [Paecilomyces variotii No. 5]